MQRAKGVSRAEVTAAFTFQLSAAERTAYQLALRTMNGAGVPYVVGGAFAVHHYAGIWRNTKDLDFFLLPDDVRRALDALGDAGFRTWVQADYWLAKAEWGAAHLDLIFGSGNWLAPVDRAWLDRGVPARLLGTPVLMAPVEELVWSKAYVAGRERYDGADVMHVILGVRGQLDWDHLIARFAGHLELLFSYLCLFRFVYPHDRELVPDDVMARLVAHQRELRREPLARGHTCRGTLLDRYSYIVDVEHGYADPREELAQIRGFPAQEVVAERTRDSRIAAEKHGAG